MAATYWLVYENDESALAGPYTDIHRCRDHAVADADHFSCRVQIHKGALDQVAWDKATLVEEW